MANNRNKDTSNSIDPSVLFKKLTTTAFNISDLSPVKGQIIDQFTTQAIHELLKKTSVHLHGTEIKNTYGMEFNIFKTYLLKQRLTRYEDLMSLELSIAGKYIPNYDKTLLDVSSIRYNFENWTLRQLHYFLKTFHTGVSYLCMKLFNFSNEKYFRSYAKQHWGADVDKMITMTYGDAETEYKHYDLHPQQILNQLPSMLNKYHPAENAKVAPVLRQRSKKALSALQRQTLLMLNYNSNNQHLSVSDPTSKDINEWTIKQIQIFIKRNEDYKIGDAVKEKFNISNKEHFFTYLINKRKVNYYDLLYDTPEETEKKCHPRFNLTQEEIDALPKKKQKIEGLFNIENNKTPSRQSSGDPSRQANQPLINLTTQSSNIDNNQITDIQTQINLPDDAYLPNDVYQEDQDPIMLPETIPDANVPVELDNEVIAALLYETDDRKRGPGII